MPIFGQLADGKVACIVTGAPGLLLAPIALLASDAQAFLDGKPRWQPLFTPTATRSLAGYALLRSTVLLELLDNVAGRLQEQHFAQGKWTSREVQAQFPGALTAQRLHD